MEILKSSGTYRILTPTEVLLNQLLIIEEAGRTSYQSQKGPITLATAAKFVRMLIRNGHESVIEHGSLSVKFTDVPEASLTKTSATASHHSPKSQLGMLTTPEVEMNQTWNAFRPDSFFLPTAMNKNS